MSAQSFEHSGDDFFAGLQRAIDQHEQRARGAGATDMPNGMGMHGDADMPNGMGMHDHDHAHGEAQDTVSALDKDMNGETNFDSIFESAAHAPALDSGHHENESSPLESMDMDTMVGEENAQSSFESSSPTGSPPLVEAPWDEIEFSSNSSAESAPSAKMSPAKIKTRSGPRRGGFSRGFKKRWSRPLAYMGGAAFLVGGLALAAFVAIGDVKRFGDALAERTGFTLEHAIIVNRDRVARAELIERLDLARGRSIFAYSPASIREALLTHRWVNDVSVERRWPNHLIIYLTERRAVAIWQSGTESVLLDREGKIIAPATPADFDALPVFEGEAVPRLLSDFLSMLEVHPDIAARLEGAAHIGEGRWRLLIAGNSLVELPAGDVTQSLAQLDWLQRSFGVLGALDVVVDLRGKDRVALQRMDKGFYARSANGRDS